MAQCITQVISETYHYTVAGLRKEKLIHNHEHEQSILI